MPYSSVSGKAWSERIIKRLIRNCTNNSILDIGAGAGNYSDLLKPKLSTTEFTALEVWKPYISQFNLESKYAQIIKEDVRKFTPEKTYGITLLGDILEHMTKEEAIEVYNRLLQFSEFILISIPIIDYPQDEYLGNPYEKHVKDNWSHDEVMNSFDNITLSCIENEIGVYVCANQKLHNKEELLRISKPTYAVYGIYNNEEKFISRFLKSVKEADQIVLCDTGSKDNTNKLIEDFINENPEVNLRNYKICVSPWRFDDARNVALSMVDESIDVCISLDMDEYLMDGWREVLDLRYDYKYTRYYHKFKTIWSSGGYSAHWHDRIHVRLGYAWKLPVHEILEYKADEKICWIDDFWVYHEPDDKKSRSSYLPLIEQSVKERPDVWKTWSFLAGEYMAAGRFKDAENAIDRAFNIETSDKGYLYKFRYSIFKAQNNTELALLNINNAITNLPGRREPYFEKAYYLYELGRNLEAYFTLLEAKKITSQITDYHLNPNAWNDEFDKFSEKVIELAKKEGLNI